MDLLTYQRTSEQELEHSANLAYARGDVEGAIGYTISLADLLKINLPRRPMPARSYATNFSVAVRYYFQCLKIIAKNRGNNIDAVRAQYGRPFKIKGAGAA